jgi:hypothetical protein
MPVTQRRTLQQIAVEVGRNLSANVKLALLPFLLLCAAPMEKLSQQFQLADQSNVLVVNQVVFTQQLLLQLQSALQST